MNGQHPRLEVNSEPVGNVDRLLSLLADLVEVHLAEVSHLGGLEHVIDGDPALGVPGDDVPLVVLNEVLTNESPEFRSRDQY